jgi:hypothetical protein
MVISQRFVRGLAANLIGQVDRINEEGAGIILVEGNETIMQNIRNQEIINIEI